jgi:hypothetical protein
MLLQILHAALKSITFESNRSSLVFNNLPVPIHQSSGNSARYSWDDSCFIHVASAKVVLIGTILFLMICSFIYRDSFATR